MTGIHLKPGPASPLPEDLIEERMRSMRETHCPCPACQVQDPFHDLDACHLRLETKIRSRKN